MYLLGLRSEITRAAGNRPWVLSIDSRNRLVELKFRPSIDPLVLAISVYRRIGVWENLYAARESDVREERLMRLAVRCSAVHKEERKEFEAKGEESGGSAGVALRDKDIDVGGNNQKPHDAFLHLRRTHLRSSPA